MRALLLSLALVTALGASPAAGQSAAGPVAAHPCTVVLASAGAGPRGEPAAHALRRCHETSAAARAGSRLSETVDRDWNWPTVGWENDLRSTYLYGEDGALAELVFDDWTGGAWVASTRYLYAYDGAGMLTDLVSQRWEAGAWVPLARLLYTYDPADRLTVLTTQTWAAGDWANQSRYTSTYDGHGRPAGDLVQGWAGGAWDDQYRFTYAYDEAGNRSHDLFESRLGEGWRNNSQNFFIYYIDNRLAEDLFQMWDGTEWRNNDRRLYAYDVEEGYDREVVSQQWAAVDTLFTVFDWQYTGRNLIAYDDAQNETENLFQLRHWDGMSWVDTSRDQTFYTSSGDPAEDLEQDWDGSHWLNRAQRLYAYQAPTVSTGTPSDAVPVLTVAPNPTSGAAVVAFTLPSAGEVRVTLHDVLGRNIATLFEGEGPTGAVAVPTRSLPAGLYGVRLSASGRTATQRLTVVR